MTEAMRDADKWTIDAAIRWACELPDRTSPEDWPEALLITGAELETLIQNAFEERDERLAPHTAAAQAAAVAAAVLAERGALIRAGNKLAAFLLHPERDADRFAAVHDEWLAACGETL